VEWISDVDLFEKIRYYLEHEEERLLIANSGQKKTEQLYSAKTFWDKTLNG
jgi:spore maturation protein CgeB